MATKKVKAVRNAATGSYTVPTPKKSGARVVVDNSQSGRIVFRHVAPKQAH